MQVLRRSFKDIDNVTHHSLLAFHTAYVPISYRLRDIDIAIVTYVYFGTRVKVNLLELHQDLRRRKLASPVYHVAQVAQPFPQNTG